MPNWDADYAKFMEKTFLKDMKEDAIKKNDNPDTYDINDGGVVPCTTTGGLAPATHLILCQQCDGENLEIGVTSILNCLDCAEVMKVGVVNLPLFESLPADQAAAQMVFQSIEFGTTIEAKDKLHTVRLIAPNDDIKEQMAETLNAIVTKRT